MKKVKKASTKGPPRCKSSNDKLPISQSQKTANALGLPKHILFGDDTSDAMVYSIFGGKPSIEGFKQALRNLRLPDPKQKEIDSFRELQRIFRDKIRVQMKYPNADKLAVNCWEYGFIAGYNQQMKTISDLTPEHWFDGYADGCEHRLPVFTDKAFSLGMQYAQQVRRVDKVKRVLATELDRTKNGFQRILRQEDGPFMVISDTDIEILKTNKKIFYKIIKTKTIWKYMHQAIKIAESQTKKGVASNIYKVSEIKQKLKEAK